jgi:hypothetical protein
MLRSISKVAGTAAAAAVASVSSPAAAHVDPSAAARYRDSSRLSKPSPGPHYIDEDYDLCTEDFGTGRDLSSQLGGVPSQEEADEATRELRATFVQKDEIRVSSPRSIGPTIDDGPFAAVESVSMQPAASDRPYDVQELTTTTGHQSVSTPAEHSALGFVSQGGNQVVARCVDLLQRDPDVQAAVVSLARDPAIWDAFVKNEKVQELMRSRNMNVSHSGDAVHTATPAATSTSQQKRSNPFLIALNCMRNAVWETMDTMVDLVNNVFGFVDRQIFGEKDSDPIDVPFKACMVLTVLVLALVVLKRNPTPAVI